MFQEGALGIRYLIKYLENGRNENFLVVKNCIDEVTLASIILLFTNNIDYFNNCIPEFILKGVFNEETISHYTNGRYIDIDYGYGYKSDSNLDYFAQFSLIRNSLAHGAFTFEKGIISINTGNFKAKFDIKWLIILLFTTISNKRNNLAKGMVDYSLIGPNVEMNSYEDFLNGIRSGTICFYRVECLTGNKETVKNKIDFVDIQDGGYNFDFLCDCVQIALKKFTKKRELRNLTFNELFQEIEIALGNTVKLSLVNIDVNSPVFQDEEFKLLPYRSKLKYLINIFRMEVPYIFNSIILFNLLQLLEILKKDENLDSEDNKMILLLLKTGEDFLIKVYAYILFSNSISDRKVGVLDKYPMECRYVHAKNIYKSYIKELNKYYKDLEEHGGSLAEKRRVLELLDGYTLKLESAINNDTKKDIFWNLRNAIAHNQVEFNEEYIRFYITGQNLKLKKFSKKRKTWIDKEFTNNSPIWEMIISKKDFLALLDELYEIMGVEVKVNISKYCKRSTYGR